MSGSAKKKQNSREKKSRAGTAVDVKPLREAPSWVLPALIAVYVFLAGLLIFRVPIGQGPDEFGHLDYVTHLAEKMSFPVFKEVPAPQYGYEFHQPPLYYLACAPFWKLGALAGKDGGAIACRLLSLLFGAVTLILLWRGIGRLFQAHEGRAVFQVVAVGFGAVAPIHLSVSASAGNDSLAGLFGAGIFTMVAFILTEPVTDRKDDLKRAALLGACVGLGLLTKTTILILSVVAVACLFHHASQNTANGAKRYQGLVVFSAVALLICGGWLLRNQMLYGDPLALKSFQRAFDGTALGPDWFLEKQNMSRVGYLQMVLFFLFVSATGVMGGINKSLIEISRYLTFGPAKASPDTGTVLIIVAICALAFLASVVGLVRLRLKSGRKAAGEMTNQDNARMLWALGLILVAFAWAMFNTRYFQVQARYFHTAFLPICLFFAVGWRSILGEGRVLRVVAGLFGCLLIGITLWNAFGWRTLS